MYFQDQHEKLKKERGNEMKLKVQDREYTDSKLIMKTSVRRRRYSIRFEKLNGDHAIDPWGHLNEEQAMRMIEDLQDFVKGTWDDARTRTWI